MVLEPGHLTEDRDRPGCGRLIEGDADDVLGRHRLKPDLAAGQHLERRCRGLGDHDAIAFGRVGGEGDAAPGGDRFRLGEREADEIELFRFRTESEEIALPGKPDEFDAVDDPPDDGVRRACRDALGVDVDASRGFSGGPDRDGAFKPRAGELRRNPCRDQVRIGDVCAA